MNSGRNIVVIGAAATLATLFAAPAMARDPYDRAHGFGFNDPYARSAVDQCAAAAESRASRFGPARVTRITNVDRKSRGFLVSGAIAVENRWGAGVTATTTAAAGSGATPSSGGSSICGWTALVAEGAISGPVALASMPRDALMSTGQLQSFARASSSLSYHCFKACCRRRA